MICTVEKTSPTAREYFEARNAAIYDSNLSIQAQHLLSYMLDRPVDWEFRKVHLSKVFGRSECTIQRWLSQLRRAGYVTWTQEFKGNGDFSGGYYSVYLMPQEAANETRLQKMSAEREREKEQKKRHSQLEYLTRGVDMEAEQEQVLVAIDNSLKDGQEMNREERVESESCFRHFFKTLTTDYKQHLAIRYVMQNLKNRRNSERRTAIIGAAKNKTTESHVRRERAKASFNNNKADEIQGWATKSTSDKLTDTSWSTGDCYIDNINDYLNEISESNDNDG